MAFRQFTDGSQSAKLHIARELNYFTKELIMNGIEVVGTIAILLTLRFIIPLFIVFSLGSLLKKFQKAAR